MIWTVVLKNGESFVVYGNAPNISEVSKAIKNRGYRRNQVAGIVRGNHEVLPCPQRSVAAEEDYYKSLTRARRAAMEAPIIRDAKDRAAFGGNNYPDHEQSFIFDEPRVYPEPQNDPRDW